MLLQEQQRPEGELGSRALFQLQFVKVSGEKTEMKLSSKIGQSESCMYAVFNCTLAPLSRNSGTSKARGHVLARGPQIE